MLMVVSTPDDDHSPLVQSALADLGIETTSLFLGDFPSRISMSYDSLKDQFDFVSGSNEKHESKLTIWNRRWLMPGSPSGAHAADVAFISASCRTAIDSYYLSLKSSDRQINDYYAAKRMLNKITQLQIAKGLGFKIPKTLISNDPKRIRDFVGIGSSIVKPLHAVIWKVGTSDVRPYTSVVKQSDLVDDQALMLCPMIFQQKIEKIFEYRAVVFGEEIILVQINSQSIDAAKIDWRTINLREYNLIEIKCPEDLRQKILCYMQLSGLSMGSFDFALDTNNEFVFFEVNEQGQFLWIEQVNPEITLLDSFLKFVEPDKLGVNGAHSRGLTIHLEKYDRQFTPEILKERLKNHEKYNEPFEIREG